MYPDPASIPQGAEVGIPAGTRLHYTTHPQRPTHVKRKCVVKVWSVHRVVVMPPTATYTGMNQTNNTTTMMPFKEGLEIVWAGAGGYWKSALWDEGWEVLSVPSV